MIDELKRLYRNKIRPMEEKYQYDFFYSPLMTDAEFDSKPQVMLVGQYSVGKTSFIRYLLGSSFLTIFLFLFLSSPSFLNRPRLPRTEDRT